MEGSKVGGIVRHPSQWLRISRLIRIKEVDLYYPYYTPAYRRKMNKNNQTSSDSRIRNFLESLPGFGPVFNFLTVIYSWIKGAINFLTGKNSDSRLPSVIYFVALCSGIVATMVSAMIEYRVMVDAYNSIPDIISVPVEVIKFFWNLIVGEQTANPTATQQGTPKKSLLPLLTVIGLEGSKCVLILYVHSNREKRGLWNRFLRFLLRSFLVGISLICSLIFFAQLMNKPNEDEVNTEIDKDRKNVLAERDKKIANAVENDVELLALRERKAELNLWIDDNLSEETQEVKTGGGERRTGHGEVARGIVTVRKGINKELERVDQKIKARREGLETAAKADAAQEIDRREKLIRKGGRALDPKWMSAILSALHEVRYSDSQGNYPRRWAVIFFGCFSVMISAALELIINEMFKRIAKDLSSSPISVES